MSKTSKRRATRAKQAAELDERLGPDQARILHVFDDGWTIRLVETVADAEREGVLMHMCMRRQAEREMVIRSTRLMQEMRKARLARGLDFGVPYSSHILSLRDEHNHPHVTFTADERSFHEIEGNGSGEPKPEYLERIRAYRDVANPAAEVIVEENWRARRSNEAMFGASPPGSDTPARDAALAHAEPR